MDVTDRRDDHLDIVMDRATEGSFETGCEAAEKGRKAIPAGPDGVDLNHAGAGESPATDQPLAGGDHVTDQHSHAAHGPGLVGDTPATHSDVIMEFVPPVPMRRLHFAHCFPELSKAEYDRLTASIMQVGVEKPIARMDDVIIDGWSRYNIARSFGLDYPVISYQGSDVLLDVIAWQRSARDWTTAQGNQDREGARQGAAGTRAEIWAAFHLAEAGEGEVVPA